MAAVLRLLSFDTTDLTLRRELGHLPLCDTSALSSVQVIRLRMDVSRVSQQRPGQSSVASIGHRHCPIPAVGQDIVAPHAVRSGQQGRVTT